MINKKHFGGWMNVMNSIHSRMPLVAALFMLLIAGILTSGNTIHAQAPVPHSIKLVAVMGSKITITFDDGAPQTMVVGQSHQGIKLLSIQNKQATFLVPATENTTRQVTVRLGQAPFAVGASTVPDPEPARLQSNPPPNKSNENSNRPGEIVLQRGRGNHFYTTAVINGHSARFIVDTGAYTVALTAQDAAKAGINYKRGTPVQIQTANGVGQAYEFTLPSITIQGVTVHNVKATVIPSMSGTNLLGQSYLHLFKFEIKGDEMYLKPR